MAAGPLSYLGGTSGLGPTTMPAGAPPPMFGPPAAPAPPPGGMGGFPIPPSMGPSMGPPGAGPMPMDEYVAETQDDNTVLLRVKNPDGSPGRAVKIVPLGGKKQAQPGQ